MTTRRQFLTGMAAAASTALLPAPRETYADGVTLGSMAHPNTMDHVMGADPLSTITVDCLSGEVIIPKQDGTLRLYRQWRQWIREHPSSARLLTKGSSATSGDRVNASREAPR